MSKSAIKFIPHLSLFPSEANAKESVIGASQSQRPDPRRATSTWPGIRILDAFKTIRKQPAIILTPSLQAPDHKRQRRAATALQGMAPDEKFAHFIDANPSVTGCPERTAIRVRIGKTDNAQYSFMHANAIRFSRKALLGKPGVVGFEGARTVAAGRSPGDFASCEKFLTQGIESGKGLFQFVAPVTHRSPEKSDEKPIIGQLQEQLRKARQSRCDLILAGRFKVVGLERIPDSTESGDDHVRFRMTVVDVDNPSKIKTTILTQAGLKFDDNVLDVAEIERANALAMAHDRLNRKTALAGQSGPMIVSNAGIGRNATLIAYREALAMFGDVADPVELDRLIDRIVAAGRRDRGPNFVHSAAQLDILKRAIQKAYATYQSESPRARGLRFASAS